MKSFYNSRDRDLERILLGKDPVDGKHEDARLVVAELRAAFPAVAIPAGVEAAHLAAMMQRARAAHRADTPAAAEAISISAGVTPASRRPAGRTQPRLSPLFASRSLLIVTVVILGLAALGGAATAGALPDALQSAVSRVAGVVGIPIPDGHEASPVPGEQDPGTESSASSLTPLPPAGAAGVGGSGRAGATLATAPPVTTPPPVTVPVTVPTTLPPAVPPGLGPEPPGVTVPATLPPITPSSVPVTVPSTVPDVPPTIETELPPLCPPPGQ